MARINIAHGTAKPAGLGPNEPWLDDATGIMYVGDRPVTGSNRNILVNGDFAVNQRGQGSYTGVGYAVDMWAIRGANGAAQIVDGGITWTMPNIGAPTMWQPIEQYKNYVGKFVTASVECPVVAETSEWRLYVHDGMNVASQPITHTGITTTSLVVSESAIRLDVYLLNSSADNTPITTSRAKLELGPISTLALDGPADYGAELARCQRYLYVFDSSVSAIWFGSGTISTNWLDAMIPLPVPMRVLPSISGTYNVFNGAKVEPGPTIAAVSVVGNGVYVSGHNTTDLTAAQAVFLTANNNKKLILSAEL